MNNLEDLEKKINSELTTKINKTEIKHNQIYLETDKELKEAADALFEKIISGKIKIEIFKKYRLEEVVQAHTDLENRKITGPAIIIPN